MNFQRRLGVLLAVVAPALLLAPLSPAQQPATDGTGYEVQTRGPLHEAFAQPQDGGQPGALVPKEPPQPIPEEPPDLRPEGDNMQWIGGYWAWDADRNDYIWISGVYRDSPPGRSYVAGYWEQTGDGWRWVAGFWAPNDQPELPYVPTPPASLEIGPSVPPPGDNYIYTPGYWFYRDTRYVWRPGLYVACQPGLVWIPPRHIWTPGGCLFVPGYADYCLERRGLAFAAVAFNRPLWRTPGWAWRPQYALGHRPLLDSLFVDIRFGHYRYGDYYGNNYLSAGIQPWHAYAGKRYDPLYTHYRWENRANAGWAAGHAKVYNDRLAGTAPRPPRTLALQAQALQQPNNVNLLMAQPVAQFNAPGVKLAKVNQQQQLQQQLAIQQAQQAGQVRAKAETGFAKQGVPGGPKNSVPQPLKVASVAVPPSIVAPKVANKLPIVKTPPAIVSNPPPPVKTVNPPPPVKTVNPPPPVKTVNPPPAITANPPPPVKTVNPPPPVKAANPPPAIIANPPPPVKVANPPPPVKTVNPPPPVKTVNPPPPVKVANPPPAIIANPPPPVKVANPPPPVKAVNPPPPVKAANPPPPVKVANPPPPVKVANPPPPVKVANPPPPVKVANPPPPVKVANPPPPVKISNPPPAKISNPAPAPKISNPPPRVQPPRNPPPAIGGGRPKGGKN